MSLLAHLVNKYGRTVLHSYDIQKLVGKVVLVPTRLLREHEETEPALVYCLVSELATLGVLKYPVLADARTLTVLDGHHRLNAAKKLGYRYIPVFFVDYADDRTITVTSFRKDFKVTKVDVVERGLSGSKYPPKTSKHRLRKTAVPRIEANMEAIDAGNPGHTPYIEDFRLD